MNSLKSLKRDILKQNGGFSIVLFIILAFLVAGIAFVSSFYINVFIFIIPILVLPLIFAISSLAILYREGGDITFTNFFRLFALFFSPHFRGTFSYIKNLLWSILIELVTSIIISAIITPIFYTTNYMGFASFILEAMEARTDINLLDEVMRKYEGIIDLYQIITSIPAAGVASLFLFYKTCSGLYTFFFNNSSKLDGRTLSFIYSAFSRKYRWKLFSTRFKNLWFMYLTYLVGFAGGAVLGYFLKFDSIMINAFALAVALFLSIASFGFYDLAFEEAHFLSTKKELLGSGKDAMIKMLKTQFGVDEEKVSAFERDFEKKASEPISEEDVHSNE